MIKFVQLIFAGDLAEFFHDAFRLRFGRFRIFRSQILLKDMQRIVIDPGTEGNPPLSQGAELRARIEWELKR